MLSRGIPFTRSVLPVNNLSHCSHQDLFTSIRSSCVLPCGHNVHVHCFRDYSRSQGWTRCPLCRRTAMYAFPSVSSPRSPTPEQVAAYPPVDDSALGRRDSAVCAPSLLLFLHDAVCHRVPLSSDILAMHPSGISVRCFDCSAVSTVCNAACAITFNCSRSCRPALTPFAGRLASLRQQMPKLQQVPALVLAHIRTLAASRFSVTTPALAINTQNTRRAAGTRSGFSK